MKELISTSTDSSLSPGVTLVLSTDIFRGSERDKCLPPGSLPFAPVLGWLGWRASLEGRFWVLLTNRGLVSKERVGGTPTLLLSRDLRGEECGEEDGALGRVAR